MTEERRFFSVYYHRRQRKAANTDISEAGIRHFWLKNHKNSCWLTLCRSMLINELVILALQ